MKSNGEKLKKDPFGLMLEQHDWKKIDSTDKTERHFGSLPVHNNRNCFSEFRTNFERNRTRDKNDNSPVVKQFASSSTTVPYIRMLLLYRNRPMSYKIKSLSRTSNGCVYTERRYSSPDDLLDRKCLFNGMKFSENCFSLAIVLSQSYLFFKDNVSFHTWSHLLHMPRRISLLLSLYPSRISNFFCHSGSSDSVQCHRVLHLSSNSFTWR